MSKHQVIDLLDEAVMALEREKPNDRSAQDRQYAILKTEVEKVVWMAKGLLERGSRA